MEKAENTHKSTLSVLMFTLAVNLGSLYYGYSIGIMNFSTKNLLVVFNVKESE